ncbi:MAG: polyprenyl synthetase family protein [Nitrospirae bacterium]|nr:polyprenyl synthetase family protein [Candidatus Troglogloeales bacterium]
MTDIDNVWFRYKEALNQVEGEIKRGLDSEVALINEVAQYTLVSGGKRIRPLLLVICANMGQSIDKRYLLLGSVVEFIHTATLLHDDVLDNARIRRGQPAARNLYGNQASILVGDFLYTRAVCRVVSMENLEMNYLLSFTCSKMTEGETWQLAHTSDFNLTEERYLKIIAYKTASLISASCKLGGVMGSVASEEKEALYSFGHNLGIAFQVADDTLDYVADKNRLGKALGQDIKEGKMTLPLIHLLSRCQKKEKEMLIELIQSGKPQKDLSSILKLMEMYGSISYAQKRAALFVKKAKEKLRIFPRSTHKEALQTVAEYVILRDY